MLYLVDASALLQLQQLQSNTTLKVTYASERLRLQPPLDNNNTQPSWPPTHSPSAHLPALSHPP